MLCEHAKGQEVQALVEKLWELVFSHGLWGSSLGCWGIETSSEVLRDESFS